jgi:hypothetical protein
MVLFPCRSFGKKCDRHSGKGSVALLFIVGNGMN